MTKVENEKKKIIKDESLMSGFYYVNSSTFR